MELKGSLLIAMPHMADERFVQSVVVICDHSAEGTLGLIVNKPMAGMKFVDVCREMGLSSTITSPPPVYFGGPVSPERGFILHSSEYTTETETIQVSPSICLSADQSVLKDIGGERGPARFILALGYSGWGPGQLEDEILRNGWLVLPLDDHLVFEVSDSHKWKAAGKRHGIDLSMLGNSAGNA